ncbi:hypothetical protein PUN4_930042 [Paraburkholderia unamae]|nr:hypothetical protein PUN4_930042 [Paraburkholderia unamae]
MNPGSITGAPREQAMLCRGAAWGPGRCGNVMHVRAPAGAQPDEKQKETRGRAHARSPWQCDP